VFKALALASLTTYDYHGQVKALGDTFVDLPRLGIQILSRSLAMFSSQYNMKVLLSMRQRSDYQNPVCTDYWAI
jgi:hypothetical protein